jgi:hypothetical protein
MEMQSKAPASDDSDATGQIRRKSMRAKFEFCCRLGFDVRQHGRCQKLSDAPGIIAVAPAGNVAIVECIVGFPDQADLELKYRLPARTLGSRLRVVEDGPHLLITRMSEHAKSVSRMGRETQGA